jgi:hypothetical protein
MHHHFSRCNYVRDLFHRKRTEAYLATKIRRIGSTAFLRLIIQRIDLNRMSNGGNAEISARLIRAAFTFSQYIDDETSSGTGSG